MKRIGPVVLEPRLAPSRAAVLGVSVAAVAFALLLATAIFYGYGQNPWTAYARIGLGLFGSWPSFSEVVRRAIPLILCGVGLTLAFRARFWNIGAEGQLLAGAVAATGVALFLPVPEGWRLPLMFLLGFLAGGLWGLLPALLRTKLGVNEVIATLMLNYVMGYIVEWLVHGPWKGPTMRGFAYTDRFPLAAQLGWLPGTRVPWVTLVLGVVLAVGMAFLLARTRLGYEIRVAGQNPEAARYAGINFTAVFALVMLLSGGLAGLAGVGEVAGIHRMLRSPSHVSMGYGYTAIIVAWLARGNPLVAVLTALFFGLLFAAGDHMRIALGLPFQIVGVFQGLIFFCLIGFDILLSWRVRLARKEQVWSGQTGS